ncbi:hypothetical protein AX15_005107 [Amanita polypyramis BW_CC]|nr:hypothetical protein AX15_005107 [Amanita polypyramis BW_CC]
MAVAQKARKSSEKGAGGGSEGDTAGVALDAAATVFRVLQTAAKASPVPGIQQAADFALQITTTIQKVRKNKSGFASLAEDAKDLVFVVCKTYQDEREEDIPVDLEKSLDYMNDVLQSVLEFAERGVSRGRFMAFVRSGVDEGQINDYRDKLRQCLGRFGLQTDINIRVMMHKLLAKHDRLEELLENKGSRDDTSEHGEKSDRRPTSDDGETTKSKPSKGVGSGMKVTHTNGDVVTNNTSSVTTNYNSGNTNTNSYISQGNRTTINGDHNQVAGDTVTNDHSVKVGDGVNFAGAMGNIVIGSGSHMNVNK